jgi:zinc D-Ala-D-Ala carboxypeptidase
MIVESLDPVRWPNFSVKEICCKHTGILRINDTSLDRLQRVRRRYGIMVVNSAYRHPSHPIEATKIRPGVHTDGYAFDISVGDSIRALKLIEIARAEGFTGIGVSQRAGQPRFVHLDDAPNSASFPRPAIWSY